MIDQHLNYAYRFNFDADIPITAATMAILHHRTVSSECELERSQRASYRRSLIDAVKQFHLRKLVKK